MNNAISRIINNDNISDILACVLNNLFENGPVNTSDLEILTYLNIYHKDFFNNHLDKILNFMGIFYKNSLTTNTLEEVVFGQYKIHIKEIYNQYYTPVQAQIIYKIDNNKCYSFSAPTSTGKSFVFLNKIKESKHDVVIVVPSRALINEYLLKLSNSIEDKSINILPFIDKINSKNAKRNIFIVTPERCREIFKFKDQFVIDLFLFDEAQLSDEESTRGILFDGIVRRCYKNFPEATFVFAHPFVENPNAQLIKNHLEYNEDNYNQFRQKNVGQIFFYHDNNDYSFYHFGIEKEIMGNYKIKSDFDPIRRVLQDKGSVLFFVSKSSIKKNNIFEEFKDYIKICEDYEDILINKYIEELVHYTGGSTELGKDYFSKLISYLKKGIVIHHGSLPLKIRSILERYTNDGLCRICFATSTLEQGVNMPFDLVYLNTLPSSKPLSVKNLIGRAGRSTLEHKFDYGNIVVKSMSVFRQIMLQDEVLDEVSLLDINEGDKDEEYTEFKHAILNDDFNDDLNLTNNQVNKLTSDYVFNSVEELLNVIFVDNEIVSLEDLNQDENQKLNLYSNFLSIYENYLGRNLEHGEENVFNTAIKIILWKVHGKTFKNICWYRYSYASQSNLRRVFKNRPSILNTTNAKFFTEYADIPNKTLPPYNALNEVLAKDVDYDFIISDTYDYLDKLISFKLIDILCASLTKYFENKGDKRAETLAKFIKFGTDNERHIMLLRYGLTFEDIEVLDEHILSVSVEKIIFKESIYQLQPNQILAIVRYI